MEEFKSRLIYPNPLQPSGVEFNLVEDSDVTLKVFDADGKEVETVLENTPMKSGIHSVALRVQEYKDGVYMYQLLTKTGKSRFIETKKLIVAK